MIRVILLLSVAITGLVSVNSVDVQTLTKRQAVSPTGLPLTTLATGSYYISPNKDNWYGANNFCRANGLRLVTVLTPTEDALLDQLMQQFSTQVSTTRDVLWKNGYWTSGNNLANNSVWVWASTGTPITWFDWFPDQPSNYQGTQNCIVAWTYIPFDQNAIKWDDIGCMTPLNFICEA